MPGLLDLILGSEGSAPWMTPGYNPGAPTGVAGQGAGGGAMVGRRGLLGGLADAADNPLFQFGTGLLATGQWGPGIAQGFQNISTGQDRRVRRGLLADQAETSALQRQALKAKLEADQLNKQRLAALRGELSPSMGVTAVTGGPDGREIPLGSTATAGDAFEADAYGRSGGTVGAPMGGTTTPYSGPGATYSPGDFPSRPAAPGQVTPYSGPGAQIDPATAARYGAPIGGRTGANGARSGTGAGMSPPASEITGPGNIGGPGNADATASAWAALDPQTRRMLAALPDDQLQVALQQLATRPPPSPMNVNGRLVDPRNPGKVLADYSDTPERLAEIERAKFNATLPGRVQVAAASRPQVNVDTRTETEFAKAYGGQLGKDAAAIHDTANAARTNLSRLDLLDSLTGQVETGKLAPTRATLGAWAMELGLTAEAMQRLGLDPKMPMNAQGITAVTNALTLGQIGAGGMPANNFSNTDLKFLQETMPQLSNTPGGNRIISQAMRAALQRNVEKEDAWLDANKAGKTYPDFLRDWNKRVKETPLFPRVADEATYRTLKPGTVYTAPDGSVRVRQ